jgi:hypothetical protein
MDPNRPISSFWGNVSYIGRSIRDPSKVVVAMARGAEFNLSKNDPSVGEFHVTAGSKQSFVVLETLNHTSGTYRVLALYRHPKADNRLVLSLRETIARGELTLDELAAWHPDYLYKPPTE